MTQIRPAASKASFRPSGVAVCQRVNVTWNGSSEMRNFAKVRSEIVRCTRAENAMVLTRPVVASTRRSLPPCATTIDLPSGVQL